MQNLLEEIREMIKLVTETIYYYRKQNHAKGHQYSGYVINSGDSYFEDAVKAGFDESVNLLFPIWKQLLEATESGDEALLADTYEQQLIPALYDIQSCLVEAIGGEPIVYWDENMKVLEQTNKKLYKALIRAKEDNSRNYMLGWALTGDMVLSVETKQYGIVRLSSFLNPWQEAVTYGDVLIDKNLDKCTIMGFGMGYHVEYLASHLSCSNIMVLENDLEQLRISMMYRDLRNLLSNNKVRIVLCWQNSDYAKYIDEDIDNTDIIYKVWYPSVKAIADNALREILENFWVACNSMDNLGDLLLDNFEKNRELNDECVDVLKSKFEGKDMVLVAGGPSLDDEILTLKTLNDREDINVVCVGKSARKLIDAGVIPNYIVMIDGKPGTRWQIRGIEQCGIPLIYLSTVAHNVASEYQSKKYVAYQEDIEPAEKYAKEHQYKIYKTGGSVATFAIDMALRMKCSRIICVGLDMGYIGDETHAGGLGRKIENKKNLRQVEAVGGGMVYTSKTLDIYRRWIERRIEKEKEVEIINSSKGARIHGMKEKRLSDCIK